MWSDRNLKQQFCVCLVFLFSLFSVTADSSELVGVLPISNQRAHKQINWLGYYIQARILSNLRSNSKWRFHSNDAVHLWKHRSNAILPISSGTTIVIEGNYQIVLRFGHLNLRVKRYQKSLVTQMETFESTFSEEELDIAIDDLSLIVGKWIEPEFHLSKKRTDHGILTIGLKEVYAYRAMLFDSLEQPNIQQTLNLKEMLTNDSPADWICDLAQGMIILSQYLDKNEKIYLLNQSERLLRNAIKGKKPYARLYALLAETYYFNNELSSWVAKTAQEAIILDPQNDLGYLLISLVELTKPQAERKSLSRLRSINPWLWGDKTGSEIKYQKGIFDKELRQLAGMNSEN